MLTDYQILAEVLDSEIESEAKNGFIIDNIDKLDWAIRKWAKIDADANQKIECAKRQIDKLARYIVETEVKAEQEKQHFETMMRPFIEDQLQGQKTKTFKAPSGKVALRNQAPEITRDNQLLLQFLKDNDQAEFVEIETKEKVKWDKLKKDLVLQVTDTGGYYLTREGEIVPGVMVTPRSAKLVVEVDE